MQKTAFFSYQKFNLSASMLPPSQMHAYFCRFRWKSYCTSAILSQTYFRLEIPLRIIIQQQLFHIHGYTLYHFRDMVFKVLKLA